MGIYTNISDKHERFDYGKNKRNNTIGGKR